MTAVVIIEDDVLASTALRQLLEDEGLDVRTYASTDSAYAECTVRPPDIVIADWCVPGGLSTHQLVESLHEMNPTLRVIFTSGYDPEELQRKFRSERWMSYLSKPVSFDRLVEDIKGLQWEQERSQALQ